VREVFRYKTAIVSRPRIMRSGASRTRWTWDAAVVRGERVEIVYRTVVAVGRLTVSIPNACESSRLIRRCLICGGLHERGEALATDRIADAKDIATTPEWCICFHWNILFTKLGLDKDIDGIKTVSSRR